MLRRGSGQCIELRRVQLKVLELGETGDGYEELRCTLMDHDRRKGFTYRLRVRPDMVRCQCGDIDIEIEPSGRGR